MQPQQPTTADPTPQQTNVSAQPLPPAPAQAGQSLSANGPKVQTPGPAPKQTSMNSTQKSLLISELRDNLVIMNEGSLRAVVACRSINFDLMSTREREGIEFAYQNFINSLYFPIQILIRSQKVDIGPYLEKLAKLRREQDNMLLGVLMDDYIDFIAQIAQSTNIMDKSFYVIIPYYFTTDVENAFSTSKSFFTKLFAAPAQPQHIRIEEADFEKAKDELRNRVQTVVAGLMQLGIRSVQLTTKELGELYYNVYNPDTAVRQPIGNFDDLTAPVTTKGTGYAPKPNPDGGVL